MGQTKTFFEQQAEEINDTIKFMAGLGFESEGQNRGDGLVELKFYHPLEDIILSVMDNCPVPGEAWTVISLKGLGLPKTHKTLVDCLIDRGLLEGQSARGNK